jgi:hypothetical protein
MAALPRRQFCAKLHVTTPQAVQWKPPLRQAAGTLAAMAEQQQCEIENNRFWKLNKFNQKKNYIFAGLKQQ